MKIQKPLVVIGTALTVFVIGAVCMVAFLRHSSNAAILTVPHVKQPYIEPVADVPGLPVRLKIPKINVDAAVESLGLTPEGDLDAPKGFENVGWYNAGPRPGVAGSAVIDGHYGRAGDKPAVFDDLHTLEKGDLLYVEDGEKGVTTFVVTKLITYHPEDDAVDVFRSSDGEAHLNIITCQGVWNKNQAGYSDRLVVFTDLVEE